MKIITNVQLSTECPVIHLQLVLTRTALKSHGQLSEISSVNLGLFSPHCCQMFFSSDNWNAAIIVVFVIDINTWK